MKCYKYWGTDSIPVGGRALQICLLQCCILKLFLTFWHTLQLLPSSRWMRERRNCWRSSKGRMWSMVLSDRMGCRKTNEATLHSLCWSPHGQSPPIFGIMKTKQSTANWLSVQISYTKPMTTNYIFHIQQLLE